MLPDPADLRAAATSLERADDDSLRQRVVDAARAAHWVAPAAERIKDEIARHDALARTASDELLAAAAHLRALASAVETLEDLMRAERARTVQQLQGDLAALPEGDDRAGRVRDHEAQVVGLPPATDPYWAQRVDVPTVPLPSVPTATPVPLATHGPALTVSIDTAAVRGVAEAAGLASRDIADARPGAAATAAFAPLAQLDDFLLPGSRAREFLMDVTGASSTWAQAGLGHDLDARQAAALAGIVERADAAGVDQQELLGDPRAAQAVDLAALLTTGAPPEDVWDAAAGLSPDDLAWLMTVVPELEGSLAGGDADLPVTWLDGTDWLSALAGSPTAIADRAATLGNQAGVDAKAIKPIKGASAAERAAYKEAIATMRSARADAARFSSLSARVPGSSLLARLSTPLSASTPVLKNIPVLSVLFTVGATALDVENGMSPEKAVIKNVTSTAVGLGAAALTTTAIAGTAIGATAAAPVLLAIGVGALAAWGTGQVIDRYGEEIVDFGQDLAGGAVDLAQGAAGGIGDAWNWAFG